MEEKITISLSKEQRDLLLKYKSSFDDHGLFRLISEPIHTIFTGRKRYFARYTQKFSGYKRAKAQETLQLTDKGQ